jgi:hypothetical protein
VQLANVSFIKGADAHVDLTDDKAVQVSPCAVAGESTANRAFHGHIHERTPIATKSLAYLEATPPARSEVCAWAQALLYAGLPDQRR